MGKEQRKEAYPFYLKEVLLPSGKAELKNGRSSALPPAVAEQGKEFFFLRPPVTPSSYQGFRRTALSQREREEGKGSGSSLRSEWKSLLLLPFPYGEGAKEGGHTLFSKLSTFLPYQGKRCYQEKGFYGQEKGDLIN